MGLGVGLAVAVVASGVGWYRSAHERDRARAAEVEARAAEADAVSARRDMTGLLQAQWVERAREAGDAGDAASALAWAGAALELGDHLEARGLAAQFWGRQGHRWVGAPEPFPAPCERLRWEAGGWSCTGAYGAWRVEPTRVAPLSLRASVGTVPNADRAPVGAWGQGWLELDDGTTLEAPGLRAPIRVGDVVYWAEHRAVVAASTDGAVRWRLPMSSVVGSLVWVDGPSPVVRVWQANGSVVDLDPVSGARTANWPRAPQGIYAAAFDPGASRLALAALAGGAGVLDDSGAFLELLPPEAGRVTVGWSEDGAWIWATGAEHVWVWSSDGRLHRRVPAPVRGAAVAVGPRGELFVAVGPTLASAAPRDAGPAVARAPAGISSCVDGPGGLICSIGSGDLIRVDLERGVVATLPSDWSWAYRTMCAGPDGPIGFTSARIAEVFGPVLYERPVPAPHVGVFACGPGGRWAGAVADGWVFGRGTSRVVLVPTDEVPGSFVWWPTGDGGSWLVPDASGVWAQWSDAGEPMASRVLPPAERAWMSPGGRLVTLRPGGSTAPGSGARAVLQFGTGEAAVERSVDFWVGDAVWIDEAVFAVPHEETIHVFDGASGAPLATLTGHRAAVSSLARAGSALVSGDHQGAIIRWDVSFILAEPSTIAARLADATGLRVADGRLALGSPVIPSP